MEAPAQDTMQADDSGAVEAQTNAMDHVMPDDYEGTPSDGGDGLKMRRPSPTMPCDDAAGIRTFRPQSMQVGGRQEDGHELKNGQMCRYGVYWEHVR